MKLVVNISHVVHIFVCISFMYSFFSLHLQWSLNSLWNDNLWSLYLLWMVTSALMNIFSVLDCSNIWKHSFIVSNLNIKTWCINFFLHESCSSLCLFFYIKRNIRQLQFWYILLFLSHIWTFWIISFFVAIWMLKLYHI